MFFQAFLHDVSTTSAALTSLKQNGCYSGREGFLCAGISEGELHYSCTESFQKTIWQTSTCKVVYLRLEQEICILAKSLIISFQYNIECVYFFYNNPVYPMSFNRPSTHAYYNLSNIFLPISLFTKAVYVIL